MYGTKHKSDQDVHEMEKKGMTHAKQAWLSGNNGVRELAVFHLVCLPAEFVIFCFQETCNLAVRLFLQVPSQLVNTIKIKKSGICFGKNTLALKGSCLSDLNCLGKFFNCCLVYDIYLLPNFTKTALKRTCGVLGDTCYFLQDLHVRFQNWSGLQ